MSFSTEPETKHETTGDNNNNASPSKEFQNDGPFAWMLPYMSTMGFVQGNTLMGAIPMKPDSNSNNNMVTETEAAARRQEAAASLQNIGPEERQRRDRNGNIMIALSATYVTWASFLADDGGVTGHVLRAFLAMPLFLAVGLKLSAQEGL